jgi:hypothetical protein
MNWDAIGAIGEIIGAVAVVATLGYLGLQTRNMKDATKAATNAIRSTALIESGRYWSDEILHLAVSTDMASIVAQGVEDAKKLDDNQRERLVAWYAQHLVATDALYYQFKDGALPPELWESHENAIAGLLNYDSFLRVWDAGYIPTSPGFRDYVNTLREGGRASDWSYHSKARIFD